jgi:hypothetical protein
MIRWYDYIVAILAADFILGMIMWILNSTLWWEPMIAGLIVGFVWQAWSKDYCQFRLRQEKQ